MSEVTNSGGSDFKVGYVAHLARLDLGAEELAKLQGQLEHILSYVEELKKVDVSGVAPMASTVGEDNLLRPDEVRPVLDHEAAMANAPATRHGQFLVPRILE